MAATIQIRRGLASNLPILSAGELAFTTDTHKTYIGDGSTNHEIGGSSSVSWAIKTANYTASNGDHLFSDTNSSAFTITLPSSPSIGDTVVINDLAGTFDSNNLTIGRNGQNINGTASDLICDIENATYTFVFSNSTYGWKYWIERVTLTY